MCIRDRSKRGADRLRLSFEVVYDNKTLHIFEPVGAPPQTNLIIMEHIDGAYTPVTDTNMLDAALSMYLKGADNGGR